MSAPRYVVCRCGHTKQDHEALAPQCSATRCTCLRYVPSSAPERPAPKQPAATATSAGTASAGHLAPTSGASLRNSGTMTTLRPNPHVRPLAPAPASPAAEAPSFEQLVAAGRRSSLRRTVTLAEKIAAELEDLRGRLDQERRAAEEKRQRDAERAAALAEIAKLEKQLAAAKERLKSRRHELGLGGGERAGVGGHSCPDCPEVFETAQRLGVHRRWKHNYRKAAS